MSRQRTHDSEIDPITAGTIATHPDPSKVYNIKFRGGLYMSSWWNDHSNVTLFDYHDKDINKWVIFQHLDDSEVFSIINLASGFALCVHPGDGRFYQGNEVYLRRYVGKKLSGDKWKFQVTQGDHRYWWRLQLAENDKLFLSDRTENVSSSNSGGIILREDQGSKSVATYDLDFVETGETVKIPEIRTDGADPADVYGHAEWDESYRKPVFIGEVALPFIFANINIAPDILVKEEPYSILARKVRWKKERLQPTIPALLEKKETFKFKYSVGIKESSARQMSSETEIKLTMEGSYGAGRIGAKASAETTKKLKLEQSSSESKEIYEECEREHSDTYASAPFDRDLFLHASVDEFHLLDHGRNEIKSWQVVGVDSFLHTYERTPDTSPTTD